MSELVWIMYFANVAGDIRSTFYIVAMCSIVVCGVVAIILLLDRIAYGLFPSGDLVKLNLRHFLYPLGVYFLSAVLCSITPNETTIYAYAGSKVIETQLEQANINGTIQNDIYLLIRKKIKDELVEVEGEK